MKTITHKLWPVSYIDDDGQQIDALYTFDPSRVSDSWVGDPILVDASHEDGLQATEKAKKIEQLKAKIADLEASL